MATERDIKEFIIAYKVCALGASYDESDESGGKPLDRNYDVDDIDSDTIKMMETDCRRFIEENESLLDQVGDYVQHGYDFFLTRNHHGAGFFDRGYSDIGEILTDAAHAYGEVYLYVGDDGMIYGS